MRNPTRLLILEDEKTDAELAVRELNRSELEFEYRRVDSKEEFKNELADFSPDLILSDYSLPQFNGLEAFQILTDLNIDIPFILCTGSLPEEVAVSCMKAGVSDYILKSSLKRLPTAVRNALTAAETKRAKEKALDALRNSEQEFRAFVETTNEWVWAIDIQGRLTYTNPAVHIILGYRPEEILGRYVFDLLDERDKAEAEEFFGDVLTRRSGWSQIVFRFLDHSGAIKYLESSAVPSWNHTGELIGFRGSDRDITERKLAEDRMREDAYRDRLTGLSNRAHFMRDLEVLCNQQPTGPGERFAVLLVDMDRFKIVNDSLGYAEGDELLKMLADRLAQSIRPSDLIARLGGDDFIILLNKLSGNDIVLKIVKRIRNDLAKPFVLGGREVFMTASIGIAISDSNSNLAEDMLRRSDTAMYRAKANGFGSFEVFDPSMHQQSITQLQLENEMRQGLERGEFCLYYQPIIDLQTELLAGFEALVRWNHPTRGLIMPADFISAAEVSGLILSLGHWILLESCQQLKAWQSSFPGAETLSVSVNLSCKQFVKSDLSKQIGEILDLTGLNPGCLKLEITESHIMDDSERAVRTMAQLNNLGVELSLDDFGTGYSSLSYLHRLPANFLKIDRSFVNRMGENRENLEIVSTIIKLARNLKMKVVAEGIETSEQLTTLVNLGCEYGQGYHFAMPLDKNAAVDWLENKDAALILQNSISERLNLIG